MLRTVIYILIFIVGVLPAYSQKQANVWYFGSAGLDFNSGAPVALTNSAMLAIEGCATMCNSNGDLLFYTDGGTLSTFGNIGGIWNSNHQLMPNGLLIDTAGCSSATQGSIIIPDPGDIDQYYLFTVDCIEDYMGLQPVNMGLRYTKIDMTLDSGLGDVIETGVEVIKMTQTPQIISTGHESVTAITHSNGIDYWVIANKTDTICAVLVTSSGIDTIICQMTSIEMFAPSPNGSWLAVGSVLYEFDNSSGLLSNPINLPSSNHAFSRNGNVLYSIIGTDLVQFDLTASNILGSQTLISSSVVFGNPILAPDGNIYFITWGDYLVGAINCPNTIGLNCDYSADTILYFGGMFSAGNPNFLQDYFYSNSPGCNPLSTKNSGSFYAENRLKIYPNPNNGSFILSFNNVYSEAIDLSISDIKGQVVYKEMIVGPIGTYENTVSVESFRPGIYLLKIVSSSGLYTRKLVVR